MLEAAELALETLTERNQLLLREECEIDTLAAAIAPPPDETPDARAVRWSAEVEKPEEIRKGEE
jgi:hypothetical protein